MRIFTIEFSMKPVWMCWCNILVFSPGLGYRWRLIYCSIPSRKMEDLKGFRNEWLNIITVLNWHPVNYCSIAEIDCFDYPGRCPELSGEPY